MKCLTAILAEQLHLLLLHGTNLTPSSPVRLISGFWFHLQVLGIANIFYQWSFDVTLDQSIRYEIFDRLVSSVQMAGAGITQMPNYAIFAFPRILNCLFIVILNVYNLLSMPEIQPDHSLIYHWRSQSTSDSETCKFVTAAGAHALTLDSGSLRPLWQIHRRCHQRR